MAVEFHLPDLGEGMVEAELVRWLVKPGDTVTLDQAIAEVQTDKAVVEIPSPAAGTILTLNVEEGQTVPLDTLLLTIEDGRQDGLPAAPATSTPTDTVASAAPVAASPAPAERAPASLPSPGQNVQAREEESQLVAATSARATEPVAATPSANGANGHHDESGAGRWTEASGAPQRRALATPAVRRLARELDIDIAAVRGSGPAGRVLTEDLRATDSRESGVGSRELETAGVGIVGVEDEVVAPMAAALAPRVAMPGDAEAGPAEERLPLRGLRKRIAENMLLSTSTMPQVTCFVEVDATGLVALRRAVKPAADAQGVAFSYLPFIVKALVQTLRQYPYINGSIDDASKEIVLKRHYHIGIATATPDGLLVPVLRHADRLTVLDIARELGRLAEAGRARKLAIDELRGSTFTISNFGAVGGYFATPLINPGEAAILGLGRIVERPWVVEGRVEPRPILPLSFSADHRLIDGELAMRFLGSLTQVLENPNTLILEMR